MTPREALDRHAHVLGSSWESAGTFTNRVGYDLRHEYVLIRKNGGQRCAGPGGTVDCDKLMARAAPHRIYDIVGGAGASGARPVWNDTGHTGQMNVAVEPQPYDGGGEQPGPQPPPPPPVEPCRFQATDVSVLLARLAAMEERLGLVEQQALSAAHDARVGALEAQGIRDRLDRGFRGTAQVRLLGTVTFNLGLKE